MGTPNLLFAPGSMSPRYTPGLPHRCCSAEL